MKTIARSGIELLLAGIAVSAVSTFAACGGATDGGTSGASSSGGGLGADSCSNGKDSLCGCRLPASVTNSHAFEGPVDAGAAGDAGDASVDDGGSWRCEDECEAHHPNGNGTLESCSFASPAAPREVTCTYYVKCVGRRPAELKPLALASTEARELLSAMATLEEASIYAFVRLARELAHHRAPAALAARARDAARDEIRHTRAMRALAARFGADGASGPRARSRHRRAPRLVDLLIENAIEGCVRETFGALMAHVQAQRATDPVVRRTMAEIAADESRHAALAWAIDAWGASRLQAGDQRRIAAARASAVHGLVHEIERGPTAIDTSELGLVGAVEARALAASLERHLWADETQAAA